MQAHASAALPDPTPGAERVIEPSAESSATTPTAAQTRALRIVGLTGDRLVCVPIRPGEPATVIGTADTDTDPAEPRYTLAIDDRLRAAVRGDTGGAAKGEIDMTPGLRPREIQSRIRAGANVEQVAAAAGCPVERIEGFAYPVLQERAAIAERARAAQPLKGSTRTLQEIVAETLADRGQHVGAEWDAFKDERGWTVTLTWQAGRSENRAEWAFSARPGTGTITARNDEATDLIEPGRTQLRPVDHVHPRYDSTHHLKNDPTHDAALEKGATTHQEASAAAGPTVSRDAAEDGPAEADRTAAATAPTRPTRRGHRPQMPSWEDVLLGTRTAEH